MECPRCDATNREGAAYCDSCGEPLIPSDQRPREGSRERGSKGLVALMTLDWFLRFAAVGIIGIVVAIILAFAGIYDYAFFFLLLGIIGIAGTWYMIRHNPMEN